MKDNSGFNTTAHVANLLQRLRDGDSGSAQALLEASTKRLQLLARRIGKNIPGVRRWEQTDDLLQNSMIRLWKALEKHRPATPLDYYRLASTIIRRELIDLSRHYFGAEGLGANHARTGDALDSQFASPVDLKADQTSDPGKLASWTEFHAYIDSLDEEQRSLGTFMILDHIARARKLGLPFIYLGYWVNGSQKMDYKVKFRPIELLTDKGWRRFEANERPGEMGLSI